MAESSLGRLIRHHDTDVRTRRLRVAGALAAGVCWMAAAVVTTQRYFATSGVVFALGPVLAGPGLVCLWFGVAKLGRALGTRQERVAVHERGIVVHRDAEAVVIAWRDIRKVGRRGHRANLIERMAGVDNQWKIWTADGRTLWFDGSTEDSEELGDRISTETQRAQRRKPSR